MKHFMILSLFGLLLQPAYAQETKLVTNDPENPTINTSVIPDKEDRNNNFYDNEPTFALPISPLEIAGEVENPGMVDFSKLPKRSVIVKETGLKENGTDAFIGAYRYDGYALFDILNHRILKKNNKAEFPPIIDMYVEIENAKGEKVILSWGEIYYPNYLNNIIIATDVMRIVPSKSKDLWPLPSTSKLVISSDLITERNIDGPTKITVKSYPRSFVINRELKPLYSPDVVMNSGPGHSEMFGTLPGNIQMETLHTIFYGKGRGIHSTQPFTGACLKELLKQQSPLNKKWLQQGMVTVVGKDGYRVVFSYSEIMNRNDQQEILLVPCGEGEDGGKFRIFPSCDFFSDRAVKAVSGIHVELEPEIGN